MNTQTGGTAHRQKWVQPAIRRHHRHAGRRPGKPRAKTGALQRLRYEVNASGQRIAAPPTANSSSVERRTATQAPDLGPWDPTSYRPGEGRIEGPLLVLPGSDKGLQLAEGWRGNPRSAQGPNGCKCLAATAAPSVSRAGIDTSRIPQGPMDANAWRRRLRRLYPALALTSLEYHRVQWRQMLGGDGCAVCIPRWH